MNEYEEIYFDEPDEPVCFIGFMGEWGLVNIGNRTKNHTYGISVGYKF